MPTDFMPPTTDELLTAVQRLGMIVRCIHQKRALTDIEKKPQLNFWLLIYGMLLDVAVLEWCKLFGTDSEPTHWKRVVADPDRFRSDLLMALAIDELRWMEYWQDMKNYRDRHVAHHNWDLSIIDHYPELTLALKSSYFYYSYVIAELRTRGETRFPADLDEYCARFAHQAGEIGRAALAATARFRERVY